MEKKNLICFLSNLLRRASFSSPSSIKCRRRRRRRRRGKKKKKKERAKARRREGGGEGRRCTLRNAGDFIK